ncbi:hypothetical protein RGF97_07665 [Streptomyces roseicoloratus]|uniref:DUF3558 domain-containing protein n=1 Tax=Streptomyces roseicoloratus TaxID=2508722 RepID=A0ABY9RRE2_9ACTN|nr:hypothetical protein [Streptomyces roseicoloratus]WMX44754.1 hypothetical protein RGF97_07665 [Streptomyces roseicoloratus]
MAGLLGVAAAALAETSGCAPGDATAVGEPSNPSNISATHFGKVCALPGFALHKISGPRGQSVHEQTSGSTDSVWLCDLSFTDNGKNGPFTRLAIVRDPSFAASLKGTRVAQAQCDGVATYFLLDNNTYPWEPQERAASGLPSERDVEVAFVDAARASLGCR